MCQLPEKVHCTCTKRSKWCPNCWDSNLNIRLERAGINNETDNEGGDNAKVRGE